MLEALRDPTSPSKEGLAGTQSCSTVASDFRAMPPASPEVEEQRWGLGPGRSQPLTAPSFCSTVDDNPDFDNLDIVARDEEERYFDEEEPEDAPILEPDGD